MLRLRVYLSVRVADCHKDRKHYCKGYCKSCYNKYYKENRKRFDPSFIPLKRIKNKEWNKNNLEKHKSYHLKHRYGITLKDKIKMIESQNGLCLICQESLAEVVDHCHTSNRVRGILCQNCNKGLGCFEDNINFLKRAINYLENDREINKS